MRAIFVFAPALLALTACLDTTLPVRNRVGLVSVRAFNDGGTPAVRGSAVFFEAAGLEVFAVAPQACAVFAYSPTPGSDDAGRTLNAGSAIAFTVGASSVSATHAEGAVFPIYNFAFGAALNFSSGDSVLVSIPGAVGGFEAMAVKSRLSEPFTAAALPPYVENEPMNLTWEPATTPGSVMVVSLRYGALPAATAPDSEIACAFADTGSAQIPALFAAIYGQATAASQDHAFIRVRERIVEFDERTRTRVRSIFEYPTLELDEAP